MHSFQQKLIKEKIVNSVHGVKNPSGSYMEKVVVKPALSKYPRKMFQHTI